MAEAVADAKWKDLYRELVRDLEDKERHWTALESALRSAAGKLALAAVGQGKALDGAVLLRGPPGLKSPPYGSAEIAPPPAIV